MVSSESSKSMSLSTPKEKSKNENLLDVKSGGKSKKFLKPFSVHKHQGSVGDLDKKCEWVSVCEQIKDGMSTDRACVEKPKSHRLSSAFESKMADEAFESFMQE